MPFINDRLAEQARQTAGDTSESPAASAEDDRLAANASRVATGKVDAERIRTVLRRNIFGQDHAIDAVHRTMSIVQAGLADKERPLASHLLVGPTGTGKTEIVRQLAATLRKGPDDFCRIDMSGMAQEHYAASFSGAPPGYSGSKEGLTIFKRDQIEGDLSMPGIVLFDEVEKAHQTVLRALLHVLDRGVLVLASGQQRFDFRNCLVFLTSNLGSREVRDVQQSSLRRWARTTGRPALNVLPPSLRDPLANRLDGAVASVTRNALESFFDPEFLNRIDEVTIFGELDQAAIEAVVRRELDLLTARAESRGLELAYDDAVVRRLGLGYEPAYGARSVRREIRQVVWPAVAAQVLHHRLDKLEGAEGPRRVDLSVDGVPEDPASPIAVAVQAAESAEPAAPEEAAAEEAGAAAEEVSAG